MAIKIYNVSINSARLTNVIEGVGEWSNLTPIQPLSITHHNPIRTVEYIDGLLYVGGDNAGVLDIYDITSWSRVGGSGSSFTTNISGNVRGIAHNEEYVVFYTSTNRVYFMNRETMDIVHFTSISSYGLYSINLDENFVYIGHSNSSSNDSVFTVIDTLDWSIVSELEGSDYYNINSITCTENKLYVFTGSGPFVHVFERDATAIRSGNLTPITHSLTLTNSVVKSLVEGTTIIAAQRDSKVSIIDDNTLSVLHTPIMGNSDNMYDFDVDQYYYYFLSNNNVNTFRVYERGINTEVTGITQPSDINYSITKSPEYIFLGGSGSENLIIYQKQ